MQYQYPTPPTLATQYKVSTGACSDTKQSLTLYSQIHTINTKRVALYKVQHNDKNLVRKKLCALCLTLQSTRVCAAQWRLWRKFYQKDVTRLKRTLQEDQFNKTGLLKVIFCSLPN